MAKRKSDVTKGVESIFKSTEPAAKRRGSQDDNEDLNAGVIRSTSVGLKTGEVAALDTIAQAEGLARNSLMRIAIRDWIVRYRAGDIDMSQFKQVETKTRVVLPK